MNKSKSCTMAAAFPRNRLFYWIIAAMLMLGWANTGFSGEWVKEPLKGLLPGGKITEEKETRLTGKVVARDEKDKKGNKVTSAFLEQDDGSLIPLPCQAKQENKGVAGKTAGKARGKDPGCWKYMGRKVEIIGEAQSITKKTKRIRRLTKISGINPL